MSCFLAVGWQKGVVFYKCGDVFNSCIHKPGVEWVGLRELLRGLSGRGITANSIQNLNISSYVCQSNT